jgi:dolichol kinase
MIGMLIAAAGTALILLLGEYLWRKRILKGEFARKFIHIFAASFAASWPLFTSRPYIVLLSLIFVAALVIVKKLGLFKSLHSVKRVTYGEVWYALSIGAIALLFKDDVIYMVAVLHMALADGLAAVVGVSLKDSAKKFIFNGLTKSIAGTLTFIVISFSLNMIYWTIASHSSLTELYISPVTYSILSSLILAFTEIAAPKGSDNVVVPMFAGFLLWLPPILVGL